MLGHFLAATSAAVFAAFVVGAAGDLIVFAEPSAHAPAASAATAATTPPVGAIALAKTLEPTTAPSPTREPPSLTSFRFAGRGYVGIVVPEARTFAAPFAGTVEVRRYQLIDGEVRVGSNITTLPFFPYVTIVGAEGRLTYRPGALATSVHLLVRDGDVVAAGDALFRVLTLDRSSWATFYDRNAPYHVVVSYQTSTGRDLDPVSLFK